MNSADRPTLEQVRAALGEPDRPWFGRCHEISLEIVQLGVVQGRVARGWCRGVPGQHSWVVCDVRAGSPHDWRAVILDPTLHTYRDDVDGLWWGTLADALHTPHGYPSVWNHGCPEYLRGEAMPLDLPPDAAEFVKLVETMNGYPMTRVAWAKLLSGPLGGIPNVKAIVQAAVDAGLGGLIPIDIVGMFTDLNPSGLYMRDPALDEDGSHE